MEIKNYRVSLQVEYWTHAISKDNALQITLDKFVEDMKRMELKSMFDVGIKEIDEDGNLIIQAKMED